MNGKDRAKDHELGIAFSGVTRRIFASTFTLIGADAVFGEGLASCLLAL
jgi:hypothetical protein